MINIIICYLILLKHLLLIIFFIWRMCVLCLLSFNPLCSFRTPISCSLSTYNTLVSIFSALIWLQGHNRLVHITIYILRNCMYAKLQLTIVTYTKLTFLLLGNLQVCLPRQASIQWLHAYLHTRNVIHTKTHFIFQPCSICSHIVSYVPLYIVHLWYIL